MNNQNVWAVEIGCNDQKSSGCEAKRDEETSPVQHFTHHFTLLYQACIKSYSGHEKM